MPNNGSNNLTTYYAKRIIGDTAAESAANALLQTGTDIAANTWILSRTNRSNTYGIKYVYDNTVSGTNDKIELYGNYLTGNNDTNTPTAWVNLHTGDIYILGKVGIGYNPETSDNTYKLYVNGTSYFNDGMTVAGNILPATNITYTLGSDTYEFETTYTRQIYARYYDSSANYTDNRDIYYGYNSADNHYFYTHDGTTRTHRATINETGLFINQPATNRDAGIIGTYDSTKVALIWSMGASYNVTANGSSLNNLYGAAYAHTDATSALGNRTLGGGHQFLWCQNGTVNTAIGNNIWTQGMYISENNGPYLRLITSDFSDISAANNGLTANRSAGIDFYSNDTSNWLGGFIQYYRNSDGQIQTFMYARNYKTDGTNVNNYIYLYANKDGTTSYAIANPAAFRDAISTWSLVSDSYNTFMPADGSTNGWYKFGTSNTSYGILPSASGGATSGHNYIGTSSWYWKYSYIDEMNTTRIRVIHNSSNTGDDAMVYLENKSNNDWAMKINCTGANYGLNVDVTAGAEYGIQTNGCLRAYHVKATSGYLYATSNSNTIQIGAQNSGCCHIYNSANIPFAFNRGFIMVNSGDIGSSSYPTGNIIVKANGRISGNGGSLYLGNSNNGGWVYLQDCCSQASGTPWKLTQAGVFTCTTINGAHTNLNGTKRELQIRYGSATVGYNGTVTVNFSPAFSNACLVVIPFCSQFQFAAAQSISVQILSKSQCKLYQYNVQSVGSNIGYVAFGY